MRGERGFALVITLIVTALLVALMVEFVNQTYVETSHSHNFVASQQAGILAESGAVLGKKLLQFELGSEIPGISHSSYSSSLDQWAQPHSWDDETGKLKVNIEEESGKLNLNNLSFPTQPNDTYYQIAQRLLIQLQLPVTLADAVVDWRSNADARPLPSGAKSPYYNTLKPPYDVKGGMFDTVEELGLVKGFTPEIVERLKPYVTVYGAADNEPGATPINVNTASKELLSALDTKMTDDLVQRILDYRKTKPIKNLNDVTGLGDISANLMGKISYCGKVFRIHSEANVGESVAVAEAVVRLGGSAPETLYWREY